MISFANDGVSGDEYQVKSLDCIFPGKSCGLLDQPFYTASGNAVSNFLADGDPNSVERFSIQNISWILQFVEHQHITGTRPASSVYVPELLVFPESFMFHRSVPLSLQKKAT